MINKINKKIPKNITLKFRISKIGLKPVNIGWYAKISKIKYSIPTTLGKCETNLYPTLDIQRP